MRVSRECSWSHEIMCKGCGSTLVLETAEDFVHWIQYVPIVSISSELYTVKPCPVCGCFDNGLDKKFIPRQISLKVPNYHRVIDRQRAERKKAKKLAKSERKYARISGTNLNI